MREVTETQQRSIENWRARRANLANEVLPKLKEKKRRTNEDLKGVVDLKGRSVSEFRLAITECLKNGVTPYALVAEIEDRCDRDNRPECYALRAALKTYRDNRA